MKQRWNILQLSGKTPVIGESDQHLPHPATQQPPGRQKRAGEAGAPKLQILRSVLAEIQQTVGQQHAEQGGVLGGDRQRGIVTHFYFDASARRSGATYSPDDKTINQLLAEQWNPKGIFLLGFVHSHPPPFRRPSRDDLIYAREILKAIPELDYLLVPIVITDPDAGRFELLAYAAVRDGDDVRFEELELAPVDTHQAEPPCQTKAGPETAAEAQLSETTPRPEERAPTNVDFSVTFSRVQTVYDLNRLARARVIAVGCVGASQFIEDLARAGIGTHVFIDPDVVTEANLATQQCYRKDLGRPKVDCLAERVLDINPKASVVMRKQRLEEIDDAEFERLASAPLPDGKPPLMTLLCGLTDSFEAQSRVNRLALQFRLPSLCAQVYFEGRGLEITFTYPGVKPACHRCMLRSRYRAYLEQGFKNTVTSNGTPIFATSRLNALKGVVAMALLHHGTEHPRWGRLLALMANRSLVQIRFDPDIAATLALAVFDRTFCGADQERMLFDEAVWLPQQPDRPENGFPCCPDCGGTGDLRNATGTFADTRVMRR